MYRDNTSFLFWYETGRFFPFFEKIKFLHAIIQIFNFLGCVDIFYHTKCIFYVILTKNCLYKQKNCSITIELYNLNNKIAMKLENEYKKQGIKWV